MDVELYWLAALSATCGLTLLVSCWIALRLRTRGVRATFNYGEATTSGAITEPHEHQFAEKNFAKYQDAKWHCSVDGCGEPHPG